MTTNIMSDADVHSWVQNQLNAGRTIPEIKSALINARYDPAYVDWLLSNYTNTSPGNSVPLATGEKQAAVEQKPVEHKSKTIPIIILAAFLLISLSYYQFVTVPAKEKLMTLEWMNKIESDIDANIELSKKSAAAFETNLTKNSDDCRNKGICNINATIFDSNIYYNSKTASYALESPKIILSWHKGKAANGQTAFGCSEVAKYPALVLSEMVGISETGLGYMKLIGIQENAQSKLEERLSNSNFEENIASLEYIKKNESEARIEMLKRYFEEIQQKYAIAKDSQLQGLSERGVNSLKESSGKETPDMSYVCSGYVASQTASYHKEFMEYIYKEFNSLVNEGKYEDAIPYSLILSGFIR